MQKDAVTLISEILTSDINKLKYVMLKGYRVAWFKEHLERFEENLASDIVNKFYEYNKIDDYDTALELSKYQNKIVNTDAIYWLAVNEDNSDNSYFGNRLSEDDLTFELYHGNLNLKLRDKFDFRNILNDSLRVHFEIAFNNDIEENILNELKSNKNYLDYDGNIDESIYRMILLKLQSLGRGNINAYMSDKLFSSTCLGEYTRSDGYIHYVDSSYDILSNMIIHSESKLPFTYKDDITNFKQFLHELNNRKRFSIINLASILSKLDSEVLNNNTDLLSHCVDANQIEMLKEDLCSISVDENTSKIITMILAFNKPFSFDETKSVIELQDYYKKLNANVISNGLSYDNMLHVKVENRRNSDRLLSYLKSYVDMGIMLHLNFSCEGIRRILENEDVDKYKSLIAECICHDMDLADYFVSICRESRNSSIIENIISSICVEIVFNILTTKDEFIRLRAYTILNKICGLVKDRDLEDLYKKMDEYNLEDILDLDNCIGLQSDARERFNLVSHTYLTSNNMLSNYEIRALKNNMPNAYKKYFIDVCEEGLLKELPDLNLF